MWNKKIDPKWELGEHQIVSCAAMTVIGSEKPVIGCANFSESAIRFLSRKNDFPKCPKCNNQSLSVIP